eukprot:gene26013-11709_t
MPPKPPPSCAFDSCKFLCTKSGTRNNFLKAYPDGYPKRGSGSYMCRTCGFMCSKEQMQVDHMVPQQKEMQVDLVVTQSKGGSNCVKNLQPLCGTKTPNKCNQVKGNKLNLSDKIGAKLNPAFRRKGAIVLDVLHIKL